MNTVEKSIERWIVQALDGEIGEDDQLALNRELIRNPDARRLMEEYRRIDEMTALALGEALQSEALPLDVATLPDQCKSTKVAPGNRRIWWLAVGAMAAGLLAAVSARFFTPVPAPQMVAHNSTQPQSILPLLPDDRVYSPQDDVLRNAGMNDMPRVKRSAGRDVFGVMGNDGNIYWIEVERVWTLRKARPGTTLERASEEL